MGTLLQDVRYGLRMLVKKPIFTIVAVLTLALGVGANTAIFSIVNVVLLHSLPYRDPDRLVRIFFNEPGVGLRDVRFSKPELDDLQTRAGVFEDVTPIFEGSENLTGAKQPERIEGVNGSFSYFSMLGVIPQIGRLFGPQDFVLGFAPVIVISDGLWRRAYGADPNVLGRTLRIDDDPYTIIGVLPRGFRHPGPTVSGDVEAFGAGGFSADPFPPPIRGTRILVSGIGRLKPGLTLAQAQARLTAMAAQLRHDFPADSPPRAQWTIEIQPLQETLVGKVRPMLLVLLGAVILIVFIASLNICGRTIVVEQQVMKDCPRIKKKLKTDASYRQIDLHPDVADYLRKFMIGKIWTHPAARRTALPTSMVISLMIGSTRDSQSSGCTRQEWAGTASSGSAILGYGHQPRGAKKTCGSSGSPTSRRTWVNCIRRLKKTCQLGSRKRNGSATVLFCRGKLFQMFQEKGCLSLLEKFRQLVY